MVTGPLIDGFRSAAHRISCVRGVKRRSACGRRKLSSSGGSGTKGERGRGRGSGHVNVMASETGAESGAATETGKGAYLALMPFCALIICLIYLPY